MVGRGSCTGRPVSWRSRNDEEGRQLHALRVALSELLSYVIRNITRPTFRGVERDNRNALAVLAL
jgi:hypothetical protein